MILIINLKPIVENTKRQMNFCVCSSRNAILHKMTKNQ